MWLGHTGSELGAEPSATGERDPIAVFGVDGIVEGTIPKLEGRMTESLADAARIHIQDGGERLAIDIDQVVAIAAPPRPTSPFRVSRRQHAVEIEAGPYRVRGIAHLPPGADPHRYVASAARKWLPLTECTVRTSGDDFAVEVVIVNLDYASRDSPGFDAPPFG